MAENKGLLYVAGPIGRTTDYTERFKRGCEEVLQLGYAPINPLEVQPGVVADPNDDTAWRGVMIADIRALLACDGIYLLRNWENSRGARLEKLIADGLGLLVLYQGEN